MAYEHICDVMRQIDNLLFSKTIIHVYKGLKGEKTDIEPSKATEKELECVYKKILAVISMEQFQEMAKGSSEKLLDDTITEVADNMDQKIVFEITEEFGELVRNIVSFGAKPPRNVNPSVLSKLINRLDEKGKLINYSDIFRNCKIELD